MLSQVQLSCFLFSYLVAFGGEIFQLLRSRTRFTRWVLVGFAAAGLVAHTAYLFNRSSESGLPPLVGSSHDWLLVLAWMGGFLYLVAVGTNQKLAVGLFLLPVMLGLILMALFVDDASLDSVREVAAHRWGMLHAATLVLGMGTVAAATICALMYLLQYRKLRGRGGAMQNLQLPSLETLTTLTQWLVVGTVALLTIGLVTGFILAGIRNEGDAGSFSWTDPIVVGTTIVWGIMVAAVCRLLTSKEQSGRQIARLTFLAGGFLLFTIFGLMLLSGGVHDRRPAESESNNSAQHDSRRNVHPDSGYVFGPTALAAGPEANREATVPEPVRHAHQRLKTRASTRSAISVQEPLRACQSPTYTIAFELQRQRSGSADTAVHASSSSMPTLSRAMPLQEAVA